MVGDYWFLPGRVKKGQGAVLGARHAPVRARVFATHKIERTKEARGWTGPEQQMKKLA